MSISKFNCNFFSKFFYSETSKNSLKFDVSKKKTRNIALKMYYTPLSFFVYQFSRKKLVQPRVLSCLHFFCDPCIVKLLEDSSAGDTVKCPTCDHITKVGCQLSQLSTLINLAFNTQRFPMVRHLCHSTSSSRISWISRPSTSKL